jgi:hypothetical protein
MDPLPRRKPEDLEKDLPKDDVKREDAMVVLCAIGSASPSEYFANARQLWKRHGSKFKKMVRATHRHFKIVAE